MKGTLTAINPKYIVQIMYTPKHITEDIFYVNPKYINIFGKQILTNKPGFYYRKYKNSKDQWLGNNIDCFKGSNLYTAEFDTYTNSYVIYKYPTICIIYSKDANVPNNPVVFHYNNEKEAEKVYQTYSGIFQK